MRKILLFVPVLFFCNIAYASTDHLWINQIQVEGDGGANDEFIELYNPTDNPITLTSWSLQYKSSSGVYTRKNLPSDVVVAAHNYYLVARNGYNGSVAADHTHSTFSLSGSANGATIFLVSSVTTLTSDADSSVVDKVFYSASSVPPSEQSLIRNGDDTDNDVQDFSIGTSNPRNSSYVVPPSNPTPTPEPPPPPAPAPTPSPSPSPQPTPNPAPSPAPSFSSAVVISEFLPNPDGKDDGEEWIELYNPTTSDIDLSSWIVDDESASSTIGKDAYVFPLGSLIKAGSYIVASLSADNFALNNTGGDTVRLFWPDKNLATSASYSSEAKIDESYARNSDGSFSWTKDVSKGSPNKFVSNSELPDTADQNIPEQMIEAAELPEIMISELFPEPKRGSDREEFIELYNAGDTEADLTGYKISDNSKSYKLSSVLAAGDYLVIKKSESAISLNNSGSEKVSLMNTAGEIVIELNYENAPVDQSYNLTDEEIYVWSATLTPGKENKITASKTVKQKVAPQDEEFVEVESELLAEGPSVTQTSLPVALASGQISGANVDSIPASSREPLWPWLAASFAVNLVFCYSLVKLMTRKGSV